MRHATIAFMAIASLASSPVHGQTPANVSCSDVKMVYASMGMGYLKRLAREYHVTREQKKMALNCLHQDGKLARQK